MPQEPKKRHSRQRQGKRRAHISLKAKKGTLCSNCGKLILPHAVCKYCGYYRGKEVVKQRVKKNKSEEQLEKTKK